MSLFHYLQHTTHVPWVIWSSLFAAALVVVTGVLVRSRLAAADGGVIPDPGLSLRNAIEVVVELLADMAEQNMGPNWRRYFPFIGTLFLFILVANLTGLIPGIEGATSNANTTWAWAIISFVVHQYVGVREHGFGYIYHFLGPSLYDLELRGKTFHLRLLAPIYAIIELISHVARIFTLAVRLLANMFADHTLVLIFLGLVPIVIPAIFLGLGTMVSVLQAFVFALLTMVYIGLNLEDAH